MKHLYRLLMGLALVLGVYAGVYAGLSIVATFSQLADVADRLVAGAGTPVFWGLLLVFTGLVLWPVALMLRLPRMKRAPADDSATTYGAKRHDFV